MSDGFDKEAEREKLREKFAEDEQEREHTQRMSELLLQGATMTNRHCDDCGDPIFRHDGQEFCPTCQATGSGEEAQADSPADTRGDSPADAQTADGDEIPPRGDARDASAPPARSSPANASRDPRDTGATSRNPRRPTAAEQSAVNPKAASSPANAEESGGDPTATPPTDPAGSGTVADARASLTRTLARFARAAEETDDPRRARDHLRAAREAAEALAALD
ncbi:Sjogren's syndrome/scleroderma autoantigen 1 family protein [Halorubrum amylolyticum]|uniref:Sjogren's syndrome/scleroderma autoantigen 1 family protein n=1 Tax=Halorubrum amylolyticum TaxID=2508724 RepID=UPI001009020B|nr:Sjogren's syndrome/scleroderma autoantigen 1 family protein [Halorubrum amylolyticum]